MRTAYALALAGLVAGTVLPAAAQEFTRPPFEPNEDTQQAPVGRPPVSQAPASQPLASQPMVTQAPVSQSVTRQPATLPALPNTQQSAPSTTGQSGYAQPGAAIAGGGQR